MRVIAGKYKGRKIQPPLFDNVRPTTDKVKEAMFAVLQNDIEDAVVIDLFAGTGGLGVEALSRGAKKVYFCDGSGTSIDLIKKNTAFLEKDSYEILRGDYNDCLRRLSSRGVKANIVLCDPPYGKGIPKTAIEAIASHDILEKKGIVTVERNVADEAPREFYAFYTTREFGDTAIDFYRNETKCAVTGTFDPFTLGHKFVVEKALEEYDFCYVVMMVNENKQAKYSVKNRLRMAEVTLKRYKKRVKIEFYDGMAVDYCRENGIKCIYRGYRNEGDLEYERTMAEYNKVHGNVETVTVRAETDISASKVKELLARGESVAEFVAEDVVGLLKKR